MDFYEIEADSRLSLPCPWGNNWPLLTTMNDVNENGKLTPSFIVIYGHMMVSE